MCATHHERRGFTAGLLVSTTSTERRRSLCDALCVHVWKAVSSWEILHKAPCCAPGWQGTHSLETSNTRGNSGTNNGRSSGAVDCGVHERVSQQKRATVTTDSACRSSSPLSVSFDTHAARLATCTHLLAFLARSLRNGGREGLRSTLHGGSERQLQLHLLLRARDSRDESVSVCESGECVGRAASRR
jgi:hypothetical protein